MERGDITALHEPFSNVVDFGETRIGDRAVSSQVEVIEALRELPAGSTVFFKDTTDFRYDDVLADERFLSDVTHTFLIRDPRDAIPSHYALHPHLECDEIGFERLYEIYAAVARVGGSEPAVVDSDDLLADPAGVLRAYCAHVKLEFMPDALRWSSGGREEWKRTSRWHLAASESIGFMPTDTRYDVNVDNDDTLAAYHRHHLPFYELLHARRITA